jgi:quercetin dioxygenase-like cupin family protein
MPILRRVLGKNPSDSKARVRNFIANRELGTQSDIHENVISPGVIVPWHYHETEEVIVVLGGAGECRTEQWTENYSAGDVIILPARVKHSSVTQVPS